MKNKLRKKHQRDVNRAFKHFHECLDANIDNNPYIIKQIFSSWDSFEDKSGGQLHVWYQIINTNSDIVVKENYISYMRYPNSIPLINRIVFEVNNPIVEDIMRNDVKEI